ncbi:MAG: fructosamine kinase family protein [Xenococcaceae cyanobacterium MO_188.B19]|nr:fructosamine kinase family protein [Xenococcaceae cyanobacterium MO_188.B19]
MWNIIAKEISSTTGKKFEITNTLSVGGGCINQGYKIESLDIGYFVKLNQASMVEMFVAEASGLKQMYKTQTLTIPNPVCWGIAGNSSYLVLEWLDFGGGNSKAWYKMGQQLALMHQQGTSERFGWELNNTIGSTPQINDWMDNWGDFFAEQRIGYQLKLAKRRGGSFPDTDRVIAAIKEHLADRKPKPSLLHGDLWSGNASITREGEPVIFDPATYYGDREADIAMTELFGGFPAAFYQGYNQQWALDSGYKQRKNIYNLYHILNHFNLFGGGYGSQANSMIQKLLK